MKPRRRALGVALLLAAAAVGGWSLRVRGRDAGDLVLVERGELVLSVDLTGTLQAERSRLIGPPGVPRVWDYKISFLAEEGSEIEKGQPVVGFDASELERSLQERKAEQAEAVETLAKSEIAQDIAREQLELQIAEAEGRLRKASLAVDVPADLSQRMELDKARIDLTLAEKELEHLRERKSSQVRAHAAQLEYLRGRRDRTAERVAATEASIAAMTVEAPVAGTVIHVVENGEKKKVGDSCWRGAKVVEIPDLTRLRGEGVVDEADAGKVRVGQRVRLRLEAHPDAEFTGRVRLIRQTVSSRSRRDPTRVVRLDVELDRTDPQRMRPGMRFRGTIELERIPDLLLAPAEAIFQSPDGPIAWTRSWRGHGRRELELGRHDQAHVEIREGLEAGDRILRHRPGDA